MPDTGGFADVQGNLNHAIVYAANCAAIDRVEGLISATGGGAIPSEVCDEQNYAIQDTFVGYHWGFAAHTLTV